MEITAKNDYSRLKQALANYGPSLSSTYEFFSVDEVPEKKLKGALSSFGDGVSEDSVLGLIDTTLFGNGKEGFLFTSSGLHYKETLEKPVSINFNDLESVSMSDEEKDTNRKLTLHLQGNGVKTISTTLIAKSVLKAYLDEALELRDEGEVAEEDKYIILEDMDDQVKENYLKVLVNLAYLDGVINEKEVAELYSLMCQINTSPELRIRVREYMTSPVMETGDLLVAMDEKVPETSETVLHLSLIKDLIRISRLEKSSAQDSFIQEIADYYEIRSEQVAFLDEACALDEKILSGQIQDSDLVRNSKEMASKAAAVGVPIAAVYLSGSVVGLSAAGITSGLAALGLGGILGLSSMVTGIGVAVLVGVGIYKGIRWVTQGGERDKSQKREFLIQQAIRNNQNTINNLVQDINWYAGTIVELLKETEKNSRMIEKLSKEMQLFSQALGTLQSRGLVLDGTLADET